MTATPNRTRTSQLVADELGVTSSTISRYAREGRIPFITTPGGHRRFDLDEVRSALAPRSSIVVSLASAELPSEQVLIGDGGSPVRSDAYKLRMVSRAVHTDSAGPDHGEPRTRDDSTASESSLLLVFASARRVLVGTTR